jgi:PAS domain-containing protein
MGERSTADWIRCLAAATLILVAVAGVLEIFRIGGVVSAWPAEAAAIVLLAWAVLAALASHKAVVELSDRQEMLSWALDSAPEAQLIVAADGRTGYANRTFHELFPGPSEPPLDRLRRALCPDPESQAQFRRLRSRSESLSEPDPER